MLKTGHLDLFARDHLPRKELQPDLLFDRPEVRYPDRLNAAVELLDRNVEEGEPTTPPAPTGSCSTRSTASPTCCATT